MFVVVEALVKASSWTKFVDRKQKRAQKPIHKLSDTEQFRGIHEGNKCFVCGAGVTIGTLDLSGIHEYPVICVNSSVILMPWREPGDIKKRFWVSTDALCMQWDYFWNNVIRGEMTRVVRNSWARSAHEFKGIPVTYYRPRQVSTDINLKGEGLIAGSSILSAIDLALLTGCKKIFLLGVDHRMINGNSHFWQLWPKKDRPLREGKGGNYLPCQRQQGRVFKSNHRSFDILDRHSKALGAKIYNCSTASEVKQFEMISLEDALKL